MHYIANIFFLILFIYLAFGVVYLFVFSFAGLFRKRLSFQPAPEKKSIAVIIPSYKEDNVILDTARRAAQHNYPENKVEVYVVADNLKVETIIRLRAIPVNVIEVKFEKSTKAKSLNAALNPRPNGVLAWGPGAGGGNSNRKLGQNFELVTDLVPMVVMGKM